MTKNKEVAELLRSFAKYYWIANDTYRSMAYRNAAMTVENLNEDITLYRDKLTSLPKIGGSIAEKIKEYLDTGKSTKLEDVKRTVVKDNFKAELYEIEGFGKSTIDELFKHFTIRSMEDLENVLRSKQVENLPGFGEKKVQKLIQSLEDYRSGGLRRNIPLQEALESAESIVNYMKDDQNIGKISVAGSLRRMKETVNDIDIIASAKSNNREILQKFATLPQVKRIVLIGETKATIILKNGIQADIRVVKPEEYYPALQYFTGSKEHNVQLRSLAKDKGYLLSEYGLFDRRSEERITINSEEDIYERLGIKYLEPTKR